MALTYHSLSTRTVRGIRTRTVVVTRLTELCSFKTLESCINIATIGADRHLAK